MERINGISGVILDSAIDVHRSLGPGLLESVYESCLMKEFDLRNIRYEYQKNINIKYKEYVLEKSFRIDFIVENDVIVELKSVDTLQPVHTAQLITYLKLTEKKLGLLINFNVPLLKQGFKRIIL